MPWTPASPASIRVLTIISSNPTLWENWSRSCAPSGGEVLVQVAREEQGPRPGVEDAGLGISNDERPPLFERFFRGADARRKSPDGSGLGLAIADAIAERHGAAMRLEPRVPRGTRATVQFPTS